MNADTPIIKSLLDQDLYSFTVGQVVYCKFKDTVVSYIFINRGKTKFPMNFVDELKKQLTMLSKIGFTADELNWLVGKHPFIKNEEYIEFLSTYRFDPNELEITNDNGNLIIKINGKWLRTIMWEVPLLALVSELFYLLTGDPIATDWAERIVSKGNTLEKSGCIWMDFGTRRRYSLLVQATVVANMKRNKGFIGTSNCYLAYTYDVNSIGTMSHQFMMGISGIYGIKDANKIALKIWKDFYGNYLSIFLPDTFTTNAFLNDFNTDIANVYDGLRQDSGDPEEWMDKNIIPHYTKLGVPLKNKHIIFSDSLDVPKALNLHEKYKNIANISFGIGTNFSNDVGVRPLSIVIKLNSINGINVVKLSDIEGKFTGYTEAIINAKRELGIP